MSATTDIQFQTLIGNNTDFVVGTKFGFNIEIDPGSVPQDITSGGGLYTGQPVGFTPEVVEIFSDSTEDKDGGTGGYTIRIIGLKTPESTEYESEDLDLNGTTPVNSLNTWWRLNRAYILTAGSVETNVGEIIVRAKTTTSVVFADIPELSGQTLSCVFTIPKDQLLVCQDFRIGMGRTNGSDGSAIVAIRYRPLNGAWRNIRRYKITNSAPVIGENETIRLEENSDIKVTVSQVSDNNTSFDAKLIFSMLEKKTS